MKTFLYLSDIHSNFEALKHLDSLPEMQDPDCEIRFGGDYIDGVDLEPDAVINTLRYVKSLCDSGKAKAILGNHDRFILDATFRPFNQTAWWLNGREETLENLGVTYRSPSDLREQLLYHYSDELEWLRDLPYYLVDGKNILVHAGFDLNLSLEEQDPETMLWVRDPYIQGAFSLLRHVELHPDFRRKTIISGHTPTGLINGTMDHAILTDIVSDKELDYMTRYFIDGGSKSGSTDGHINILMLDENGNEVKQGYLDKNGYHSY